MGKKESMQTEITNEMMKKQAIAFADWVTSNGWSKAFTYKDIWESFDERITGDELYEQFLKSKS